MPKLRGWIKTKSGFNSGKFNYKITKIRKCSGFLIYWKIEAEIYWTGKSWFVTIKAYNTNKNGKDFHSNVKTGLKIQKHNNKFWKAKRFCEFIINNMPDYIDNIRIEKEQPHATKE